MALKQSENWEGDWSLGRAGPKSHSNMGSAALTKSHTTTVGLRFLPRERGNTIYCHDTSLVEPLWVSWAIPVEDVSLCLAHGCSIIYIIHKENNGRNGKSTGISRLGLDNHLI